MRRRRGKDLPEKENENVNDEIKQQSNKVLPCMLSVILLFAVLTILCRLEPYPVQVSDITSDGGKWVEVSHSGGNRIIEYFVCGSEDGIPMYVQHGYGGTGKYWVMDHMCQIAKSLTIKIISPSMPGFGYSSAYPIGEIRSLKTWHQDIQAVLRHANVGDETAFYVSGVSAGCVHAAAIANAFKDRIIGISFFAPTAPDEIPGIHLAPVTRAAKQVLKVAYIGDLVAYIMGKVMLQESRFLAAPDVYKAMKRMENESVEMQAIRKLFLDDCDRGSVHTHQGWHQNMHVITESLPFNLSHLEEITNRNRKIIITSAPDDTTNSPEMQKWFAGSIKGSRIINADPGYGHVHVLLDKVIRIAWEQMIL